MTQPVFRFAPSPNGYLHLGHALSALLNFDMARAAGGCLLLRVEDIDAARCRPEYEAAIYEDLAWLGIEWEEPVRRQSEHLDDYRGALERLAPTLPSPAGGGGEGRGLVYPSFETRAEIARLTRQRRAEPIRRDPDGAPIFVGGRAVSPEDRAERMAAGEPYALRFHMDDAITLVGPLQWIENGAGLAGETGMILARPQDWGDVVLARKDTPTSYHLSVVVDDALQGVTHVVRGRDLFFSTSVHRVLQALLGVPAPIYHHHRLVLDDEGRKLAKSTGAIALRELRARGATPADIRRLVGHG